MSTMGDRVLTEKTRVMITLSNFILLIFTIISGVIFTVDWKADVEHRLSSNEEEITIIKSDIKDGQALQIITQTTLAEIQTDLKWIRLYMEKDK